MADAKKSKLKRDREPRGKDAAEDLILTRIPTAADPVGRRFVPTGRSPDVAELAAAGVLDWRKDAPAPGSVDLDAVADKIVCADAVPALNRLPSASVACIITSPPYWNLVDYGFAGQLGAGSYKRYLEDLLAVWRECERVLMPNGKLCFNTPIMPIAKKVIGDQHTRHLKNLNNDIEASILAALSLQRYSLYIWQKQTTEKMFGSYPYPPNLYEQNTIEFINVMVKPGKPRVLPKKVKEASRLTDEQWMDLTRQVWTLYPEDVKRARHPAPFPESLPNRVISMYTFAAVPAHHFPGDLVLDPFNGTGATCLAAKKLGRRFIGIDLSPHFCLMARERLENVKPPP